MKSERLNFVIELLTTQMNHWLLFPIVMTASGIARLLTGNGDAGNPDFLLWTICGLFPVLFFLIRYFAERAWLFFLCHGAVMACALILPVSSGVMDRVICGVCAASYLIHSLTLRLRENAAVYSAPIHPIAALALSVAADFMLHKQDNAPDWDRYYIFTLIGVLACYVIIFYLRQYLKFLQVNRSSAGYLPAKELLRSGMGFVLSFTLGGVAVLLLSLNAKWLEPLLRALQKVIVAFLRFLFGHSGDESTEELIQSAENTGAVTDPAAMGLPTGGTFWLWEVLEYVAIVLFAIGVVFVLVRALFFLVKLIQQRFGEKRKATAFSPEEEAVHDVREKCGIAKKDTAKSGTGFFRQFTPVERIRRMYKKQVLSGSPEGAKKEKIPFMTARECIEKLSLPDMAGIYEKARYSDSEVTAEDVKKMKSALSK